MKKNTSRKTGKAGNDKKFSAYPRGCTIGLDVSDEYTHAAVVNEAGELVGEEQLRTREGELREWFSQVPASVVALETGTHSRWIEKAARSCGHRVLVANARQLRLIYAGTNKTDRLDARKLARLARVDPELLSPIQHRSDREHEALWMIGAREALVEVRTKLINTVRGAVKAMGARVPSCGSEAFPGRAHEVLPSGLRRALAPLLEQLDSLNEAIQEYERELEHTAQTEYPETELMTQVPGVGTIAALTFRLTIGDPRRFERSRDVGCYVGLRPKRDQSGEQDPALGISKAGNPRLRRTLVNCAHYMLGPFGPDTDLRRWGLGKAHPGAQESKGRSGNKKRAVVAVARKLAVLLHRLWTTGEVYEPLRNNQRQTAPVAA